MGTKKDFEFGRRGGKTDKAVDVLKNYISGFSKKEREQIERELEQEKDSEEEAPLRPSFKTFTFKDMHYAVPNSWGGNVVYYDAASGWTITDGQKSEIAEDVQDVSFED